MKRATIKPAREGAIIRNSQAGYSPLPAGGCEVELTSFWQRRIKAGDVVLVKDAKAKPAARGTAAQQEQPAVAKPQAEKE